MKKNKIIIIFLIIVSLSFITVNVYADDYPDDIYDGDYSLKEMLENYNVITFGKKDLDSHMTQNSFSKGNAKLFHINSRFLINGNLKVFRADFLTNSDNLKSYTKTITPEDRMLFCGYNGYNGGTSYNCGVSNPYVSDNMPDKLYTSTTSYLWVNSKGRENRSSSGNYMNFDRLYDSITTEQNKIRKGRYITSEDSVAHLETGGEYYIDDINDISEIVFDNFEDNQDNLTVITINNTESINFPKIYASENNGEQSLISTNDYIGMERPNSNYADYYVIDKYYGNIIWNIPNATYIELPSAPFIGHLVAPNADLYGPELHYAGTFLVNSLYLEGNSEAHFYPLTSTNIPYRSSMDNYKAITKINKKYGNIQFNNGIDNELLEEGIVVLFRVETKKDYLLSGLEIKDENGNNVEFREIGNGEYEFTMPATNVTITPQSKENNIINQIITNPKTGSNIMLVLGIVIVGFVFGFRIMKKEKNKIM